MPHLPLDFRACHPYLRSDRVIGAGLMPPEVVGAGYRLRVLLDRSSAAAAFDAGLPRRLYLPEIGEVQVVPEESSAPIAHAFTAQERPVRPGMSLSPVGQMAGTACAIVRRPVGVGRRERLLLSCEHVLFPGSPQPDPQPILQPAASDGARFPANVIGWPFARAGLFTHGINEVDAALIRLKADVHVSNQPVSEVFHLAGRPGRPTPGQGVTLYGRSSGRLKGVIEDQSIDAIIGYETSQGQRQVRFRRLVRVRYDGSPRGGDSGAPVVLGGSRALVGMHIGGSGNSGYFCRIETVFQQLQIDLY